MTEMLAPPAPVTNPAEAAAQQQLAQEQPLPPVVPEAAPAATANVTQEQGPVESVTAAAEDSPEAATNKRIERIIQAKTSKFGTRAVERGNLHDIFYKDAIAQAAGEGHDVTHLFENKSEGRHSVDSKEPGMRSVRDILDNLGSTPPAETQTTTTDTAGEVVDTDTGAETSVAATTDAEDTEDVATAATSSTPATPRSTPIVFPQPVALPNAASVPTKLPEPGTNSRTIRFEDVKPTAVKPQDGAESTAPADQENLSDGSDSEPEDLKTQNEASVTMLPIEAEAAAAADAEMAQTPQQVDQNTVARRGLRRVLSDIRQKGKDWRAAKREEHNATPNSISLLGDNSGENDNLTPFFNEIQERQRMTEQQAIPDGSSVVQEANVANDAEPITAGTQEYYRKVDQEYAAAQAARNDEERQKAA